jgi:epsilon-lactone hydrolase
MVTNEEIAKSRVDFEMLGDNYPAASGVKIEKQLIENIDCYWFKTPGKTSHSKIAIYLHGGCFVFGSVRSHQALVSHLARNLEVPILFIEYSLAPEKPYPNAVDDIFNVYRKLQFQYHQSRFILIGDSAGGWLSVALLSKLNNSGLQMPKYNIMISPWIDLTCSSNSITENSDIDPILNKNRLLELVPLYIKNQDLLNSSIVEKIHEGFPSTLILVGSREILLDDSKMLYDKIRRVQPRTKLSIFEGQTHVWLLDSIESQHSQNAIQEIKTFLID